MRDRLLKDYYRTKPTFLTCLLTPLSWIYFLILKVRHTLYRYHVLPSYKAPVPVIIVGNIVLGGTGKTPLVIALAQTLKARGFSPGIISRGYGGGRGISYPHIVTPGDNPKAVGDEPIVISQRSHMPVVVDPNRRRAIKCLLDNFDCNVILSDDGLQHYALQRDIEIAVIDGERRFGNGKLFPAGPLREPSSRLQTVDYVVTQGTALNNEFGMQLHPEFAINLKQRVSVSLETFKNTAVHAVAGIGNPARFFNMLISMGIQVTAHPYSDHHWFTYEDIEFDDEKPVLMTEKDAVKCYRFADKRHWYIPVIAQIDDQFFEKIIVYLNSRLGVRS